MTNRPLVSIITPSFNQVAFLEQTLRSVLDQDYPNIEYIVVDGGSTDGSVEIIKKYEHRLAWWVSEKDQGQADAINKGFRRARGDYIAWLNSDDSYLPGAIAEAVSALNSNSESGFVFGNVDVLDNKDRVINSLSYGEWEITDLMSFHIIGQPAVFMRRSVLEQAGSLDLNYHFLLDHHLWLRMGTVSGMKYVRRTWAKAHYHPESKNFAQAAEFGKEAFRLVDWMREDPRFAEYLEGNLKKVKAGAERINAFYLLDARRYRESFQSYWRGLILYAPAVLPDWYRMLFALLAPLGLEKLKNTFLENRRKKFNESRLKQE